MRITEIKQLSRLLLTIFIAASISVPVTAGKIYRWVDENGQMHFSDSPHNAPEDKRSEAKECKPDSSNLSFTKEKQQPVDDVTATVSAEAINRDSISIPYTAKEGSANRVIIDITFNGSIRVPIMVDTGSPGLVISNDLANRLELFDRDGSQLMVMISGIGGQQTAARTIIDKLTIGGITEEFVPAHIVPEMASAYQGLIGMDILSKYTLTIDSVNKRLIANAIPEVQDLPGGRNRSWWQTNFREFNYYNDFWEYQADLIKKSDSPYTRLAPSELKRLKDFIQQQKNEAQKLYNRLERFARWRSVPRHWRR